jgi:Na+/melibiose symporter-like transporter
VLYELFKLGTLVLSIWAILSVYLASCLLSLDRETRGALSILPLLMVFPILVGAVLFSDQLLRSEVLFSAPLGLGVRQGFILSWLIPVAMFFLFALSRVNRKVQSKDERREDTCEVSALKQRNSRVGDILLWSSLLILIVAIGTLSLWALRSWPLNDERQPSAIGAILFMSSFLVSLVVMWRMSHLTGPPKLRLARSLMACGVCNMLLAGSSIAMLALGSLTLGAVAGVSFLLSGIALIVAGRKLVKGAARAN